MDVTLYIHVRSIKWNLFFHLLIFVFSFFLFLSHWEVCFIIPNPLRIRAESMTNSWHGIRASDWRQKVKSILNIKSTTIKQRIESLLCFSSGIPDLQNCGNPRFPNTDFSLYMRICGERTRRRIFGYLIPTAYLQEQGHFSVPELLYCTRLQTYPLWYLILWRLDSWNTFFKIDDDGNGASVTSTYGRKQTSFIYGSYYNQVIYLPITTPQNLSTRRNLNRWRQIVERTLRPRKLDGHLVNSRPKEEDAHYFKWLDEEDILLTWLLNSMKPELSDWFIDYDSDNDIWDAVIKLYPNLEDESRMVDLNKRDMELLQQQRSVFDVTHNGAQVPILDEAKAAHFHRPI